MKTIKGKGTKISRQPVAARSHSAGGGPVVSSSGSPSAAVPSTTPGGVPVLHGGRIRMPGAPRRRKTSSRFHLPTATQRAMLRLPEVRDWWTARERQILIETAIKLMAGGVSMNRAAKVLDVPASWLSVVIPRYQREGFAALMPQLRGRVGKPPASGKPMKASPCSITFQLIP